jgi:regulator of RNase E activity RraA
VLVMDSRKDARAASAGAILVTRLMRRGVAGVVTDGGFRDSAEIARLGFPAYHQRPSAPTNLTLHQAIDIDVPIGCGDAPVFPGDTILGDGDGVMVIPASLVDEIAEEAFEMTAFEDVAEQVNQPVSTAFIRRPLSGRDGRLRVPRKMKDVRHRRLSEAKTSSPLATGIDFRLLR